MPCLNKGRLTSSLQLFDTARTQNVSQLAWSKEIRRPGDLVSLMGRHGSGNESNFESVQNKSKACSSILDDREYDP